MVINLNPPTNWKTTLSGLVTAASLFIVANPGDFSRWPIVMHLATFTMAGGMAAFGFTAKDSNVTGGTKINGSNDPTVVKATNEVKEP